MADSLSLDPIGKYLQNLDRGTFPMPSTAGLGHTQIPNEWFEMATEEAKSPLAKAEAYIVSNYLQSSGRIPRETSVVESTKDYLINETGISEAKASRIAQEAYNSIKLEAGPLLGRN